MLNLRYLLRLPLRSMKKQDRGIPHPHIVATHILWPISTIFNLLASLSIRSILQDASENSSQSKNFCPSWSLASLTSSIWQEVQGQSILTQIAGELIALQRESSIYSWGILDFHSIPIIPVSIQLQSFAQKWQQWFKHRSVNALPASNHCSLFHRRKKTSLQWDFWNKQKSLTIIFFIKFRRCVIFTIVKLETAGWKWATQLNWTPSVTTHIPWVKKSTWSAMVLQN